jgi:hypothetical protein
MAKHVVQACLNHAKCQSEEHDVCSSGSCPIMCEQEKLMPYATSVTQDVERD